MKYKRPTVAEGLDLRWPIPESISDEQARELAEELGVTGAWNVQQIRGEISAAVALYRGSLHIQDIKRPKTLREELASLILALGAAQTALEQLSCWSRLELDDTLRKMLGNDLSAANTTASIRSLLEAAGRARGGLPDGGGNPDVNRLRQLCGHLAWVCKRYSEPPPTPETVKYWVERAVEIIDPEVTESNLSTALRDIR